MGRRAIPDEEKIARGIVDKRRTEDARERRVLDNIRVHPALLQIPEPKFKLEAEARSEYDTWTRLLFERGLLTTETHSWVSTYALSFEAIVKTQAAGKTPSGAHLKAYNDALIRLEKLNVKVSLTPVKPEENRFAVNGFPSRLRRASRN